jgi:4-oxalocrotonate tautomerase family enzyme
LRVTNWRSKSSSQFSVLSAADLRAGFSENWELGTENSTADQKRKIAQRITDTMVEEAGARREAIMIAFYEVSKESYASGGVLLADKQ